MPLKSSCSKYILGGALGVIFISPLLTMGGFFAVSGIASYIGTSITHDYESFVGSDKSLGYLYAYFIVIAIITVFIVLMRLAVNSAKNSYYRTHNISGLDYANAPEDTSMTAINTFANNPEEALKNSTLKKDAENIAPEESPAPVSEISDISTNESSETSTDESSVVSTDEVSDSQTNSTPEA